MPTIEEIKKLLAPRGIAVMEFDEPTPDAPSAAAAVGCTLGEIAKSMLLLVGGVPVMVIASGDARVNSSLLKKGSGLRGKVLFPDADEVLRVTGYAPGGVSPFLLPPELPVILDTSLQRYATVYPAAGNDRSAVPVTPALLEELTGGITATVCTLPDI